MRRVSERADAFANKSAASHKCLVTLSVVQSLNEQETDEPAGFLKYAYEHMLTTWIILHDMHRPLIQDDGRVHWRQVHPGSAHQIPWSHA